MQMYIQEPIYTKLRRLSRFRGITIQELLVELLETVDDDEQDEAGYYSDDKED